jgi:hypothetical protein
VRPDVVGNRYLPIPPTVERFLTACEFAARVMAETEARGEPWPSLEDVLAARDAVDRRWGERRA